MDADRPLVMRIFVSIYTDHWKNPEDGYVPPFGAKRGKN